MTCGVTHPNIGGGPCILETHPEGVHKNAQGFFWGPVVHAGARLSNRIYVASSWRNEFQQAVVHTLRAADFEVYDFKNPPNGTGFAWNQVGLVPRFGVDGYNQTEYFEALEHPRAVEGFNSDFDAMKWADTFVLVLPCGRSAHLELGWAAGQGKRTAILLEDPVRPAELMYKVADYLAPSLFDLLGWLGVED